MITLLLALALFKAFLGDPINIPVTTKTLAYQSNKMYNVPGENLFTADAGTLTWHPTNLAQALILASVDKFGCGIDIFHISLLYIYLLVFYFMIKDTGNNVFFNSKVSKGFYVVALSFFFSTMLEFCKFELLSNYIEGLTKGQFVLERSNSPHVYYIYLSLLLLFLIRFPAKAQELQDEQSLTI